MKNVLRYVLREEAQGGDEGSAGAGGSSPDSGSGANEITADNWQQFIPEDLRANESLAKFTTIEGLAKSYINAESMIGRDKIAIPKTDEEYETVYNVLGRPESPDKYLVKPEGEAGVEFLKRSHQLGLNNKQAEGIVNWYKEVVGKTKEMSETEIKQARETVESELKETWGERYKGNFNMAKRFLDTQADDDFLDFLEESKLGNDPRMIKFLHKVASQSGEDNLEDGDSVNAQTPDQIQEEINEMMKTSAYRDKDDPNHDIMVKNVSRAFQRLHSAAA